jgi:ArsR family transcriptional regulator
MTEQPERDVAHPSGDALLEMLSALASPHRLRIIAALGGGRQYVSKLAREIGMSRPLLHMHLQRLEAAGLVSSTLELSDDGKAMKYFSVTPFELLLTPEVIAELAPTIEAGSTTPAHDASEEVQ